MLTYSLGLCQGAGLRNRGELIVRVFDVAVNFGTSALRISISKAASLSLEALTHSESGRSLTFLRRTVSGGELWCVDLECDSPSELNSLQITCEHEFCAEDTVFANGYQSWTDARERPLKERVPGLPQLFRSLYARHKLEAYGDYSFVPYSRKAGVFTAHTYAYIREKSGQLVFCGSLSERSGYTLIEVNSRCSKIFIRKDCEGLVVDGKRRVLELFVAIGKDNPVFDSWFSHMGIMSPTSRPAVGWTSWYYHYTNISQEIILANLHNYSEKKIPLDVFQVDDGWQKSVGDWLTVNEKFPNGMKPIADAVRAAGYRPGLWLAPFICEKKSDIFNLHSDWLARDADGNLLIAGNNDGWSGEFYALDIYHSEVRNYLRRVFDKVLVEWGFDLVKLDFLYAVALAPRIGTKVPRCRGEIMCDAMDLLRELVGSKQILGCGVPLGPAFGKVDYCRIGCDVGLGWDDREAAMVHYRERISTVTSITNAIGRRHLDGRAFWNDPDVFLLRDEANSLSKNQRHSLFLANIIFGNLVFTSDDISKYTTGENGILKTYLSQFPFTERRIDSVKFLNTEYAWKPRSTILQWALGEYPYANVALVRFSARSENCEWESRFAAFNLGAKEVQVKLPEGEWWAGSVKSLSSEAVVLEPFESRCWGRLPSSVELQSNGRNADV